MRKAILTINTPMRGYSEGDTVKINTDENGTPLDAFWRGRLKDASIDKCCSLDFKKPAKKRTAKGAKK